MTGPRFYHTTRLTQPLIRRQNKTVPRDGVSPRGTESKGIGGPIDRAFER